MLASTLAACALRFRTARRNGEAANDHLSGQVEAHRFAVSRWLFGTYPARRGRARCVASAKMCFARQLIDLMAAT